MASVSKRGQATLRKKEQDRARGATRVYLKGAFQRWSTLRDQFNESDESLANYLLDL